MCSMHCCAQSDMNEGQEGQYIAEATATLKQQTGQAPRGWLGPWISESPVTPDLLQVHTISCMAHTGRL